MAQVTVRFTGSWIQSLNSVLKAWPYPLPPQLYLLLYGLHSLASSLLTKTRRSLASAAFVERWHLSPSRISKNCRVENHQNNMGPSSESKFGPKEEIAGTESGGGQIMVQVGSGRQAGWYTIHPLKIPKFI